MLQIKVHEHPASVLPKTGPIGKITELGRHACRGKLVSGGVLTTHNFRQILAFLHCLAVSSFLCCASVVAAQSPPDAVMAAVGPLGVQISFIACEFSTEGNCVYPFSIYRSSPPGATPSWIGEAALGNNGFSYQGLFNDQKQLTKGQTYTYRVCSGASANSSASNCLTTSPVKIPQSPPATAPPAVALTAAATTLVKGTETNLNWTSANATSLDLEPGIGKVNPSGWVSVTPALTTTYTLTATGPGGKTQANVTITVPCFVPPPQNVTASGGIAGIDLKWTNPNTTSSGTCPAPTQVLVYRLENNEFDQLAALQKPSSTGILPAHYMDNGPLQPHMAYLYDVCEGSSPNWVNPTNCAQPRFLGVSWGVDPVLTATRVNANTVQLRLGLDQNTVSSIVVTRQASDDPCRQGQTLGNGLQGCADNPVKLAQNALTLYNWTLSAASPVAPGFQNPQTAPYVINIPDDTSVKPGVQYYYQAAVIWASRVEQDSGIVTVPSMYATIPAQGNIGSGIKLLKPSSGAPPPQSESRRAAATMVGPRTTPPPLNKSVTAVSPMMAPVSTQSTPMLRAKGPLLSSTGTAATQSAAQLATPPPQALTSSKAPAMRIMPPGRPVEEPPGAANLNAAVKQVQLKPRDAQALYALGQAYCVSGLKNAGVSDMYMALLIAEQTANAPLVSQIKASLAAQGVNAK